MQLFRGLHNLPTGNAPIALTIGNFDGVHLGHQAIIKRLVAVAKAKALKPAVMFFEPHPEELFLADKAPARLTRWTEKLAIFRSLGVEQVFLIKFTTQFSKQTAENFIEKLLVEQLNTKHLIVGDDFKFGVNRSGDYGLLEQGAQTHGFEVENTASIYIEQQRVSSTLIRTALADNNLNKAKALLGRDYSISGKVFHGDKRGRTIGFATANIALNRINSPLAGVYLIKVTTHKTYYGVANIGTRPTVNGTRAQLEAHLFNFNDNLYGKRLKVAIIAHLRDEQRFDSLDALVAQIEQDVLLAKEYIQQFNLTDVTDS
jgi:riboflavin kinase / FMN adenylyltransferase